MRHQSKVESPAELQPLHPVLSHALASLDIQLEEELARYRRLRNNPARSPRQVGRSAGTLDLISVPGAKNSASWAANDRSVGQPQSERGVSDSAAHEHHAVEPDRSTAPVPPVEPTEMADSQSDLTFTDAFSGRSLLDRADDPETEYPLDHGSTSALANPLNPQNLDDYLESSEELLRSLAHEEAAVQTERSFMQSLLTPLGMGSLLLLLLSSAMFGYLVMNPSSVGRLFANRNSNQATSGEPGASTESIRPQPNLAVQEFNQDLSLATLGNLKAKSQPSAANGLTRSPTVPGQPAIAPTQPGASGSSTLAPSTATAPASSASAATTVPPAPAPATAPRQPAPPVRTYQVPQPARQATAPSRPASTRVTEPVSLPSTNASGSPMMRKPLPAASASSSPSPAGVYDYKVVTPYESDRSLEAAQKVVPDPFIRNFPDGARVQLGAYRSEADAEARAQELRRQGISAEVYKP